MGCMSSNVGCYDRDLSWSRLKFASLNIKMRDDIPGRNINKS